MARINIKKKRRSNKSGGKARALPIYRLFFLLFILAGLLVSLIYLKKHLHKNHTTHKYHHLVKQHKKATSKTTTPQFDFYTILPNRKVNNPTTHAKLAPAPVVAAKPLPATNQYFLQVASFHHFKDADNLKAKLALLGFEAHISKYNKTGSAWYRVRLGPFALKDRALHAQHALKAKHFQSLLLKVKNS